MAEEKKGFFKRLVSGLTKTRDNIVAGFDSIFSGFSSIDDDFYEELEETLIMGDIGVRATDEIIEELKSKVKENKIKDPKDCKQLLIDTIREKMNLGPNAYDFENQKSIVMLIGVNGVGKTTTIAKLANYYTKEGKKVIIAAGDTFRAAAADQLSIWADRVGVPIVKHKEGADPAAVVYDAMEAAKARNADMVIVDTAGRLHTKVNLMEELKKMGRVANNHVEGAPHQTLLVLDGTTGQNAVSQAKLFGQAVPVNGIVVTKLDGTAKGGVVISIKEELGVPVRWIGVGEGMDDLRPFNAKEFANALFNKGMIQGDK